MSKVSDIKDKQREKLEKLSSAERAKYLMKRGMQEIRAQGETIPEPENLASGKSDKDGKMCDEDDESEKD